MANAFHTQIRKALANPGLHAALDANTEHRLAARQQAMASLPEDLQVLRRRAHEIRKHVITHLDDYLEQFISKVQSNGIAVHRAATAAEAVQTVLDIARLKGARLIAKSKSMVTEEIGLNQALESAGLRVVETDLGEFIVQLRGERPAHIITPAVHLRRDDVGRTFQEKLGIPYTDDIPTLTTAARQALRQVFLEADIGISGVNFGVVESGTLCIVTNEGNGRMVTTLPPVHIAIMGIERLVPSLDDLALMLELLPRSATGQKLSVYTTLIHAPRQPGDPDGCPERHLVLVDNGRSALRHSPLAEALLCIRCGACLNVCPVYREIGGHSYVNKHGDISPYPGPIGSIVAPGFFGVPEFGQLARASSLCGACREACPVDIDLPKLLLRVRSGASSEIKHTPINFPWYLAWGLQVFSWIATRPGWFLFSQKAAGFFSRLLVPWDNWLRLPAFTGWGYSKDFPQPAIHSFHERWASIKNNESPPLKPPSQQPPTTESPTSQSPITESLINRFSNEFTSVGGNIVFCKREEVDRKILALLQERCIDRVFSWEAEHLPAGIHSSFSETFAAHHIQITHQADPQIKAGLTSALAAIAETGSLVITAGAGRPLCASLLPEIHIVVIEAHQIFATISQVLGNNEIKKASTTVLITGPSRTADIEMTLTIGVHGPREVHAICILDPSAGNPL